MADPHILQLVDNTARKYGVPIPLARALVNQESGFNPRATSPVGAGGLMQLMPGTAAGLGVKDIYDPAQNVEGGMKYLSHLMQEFGDPRLALAAYNAGPGAVKKYGGVPPYKETQNYVQSILSAANGGRFDAAWGDPKGPKIGGKPGQGQSGLPPIPKPQGLTTMADLLQFAAPSQTTQNILQKLGGTAASVAERAAEPIPLPQLQAAPAQAKTSSGGEDPYDPGPQVSVHGLNGNVPMAMGGKNPFTNIHFAGHVDFQHVNHRLLEAVNKEAAKLGKVATVISGYRSNQYSARVGGFKGDPHTKGLAVDVYINGHPIGDVIPPEVWAKYGIRSGNTPGFYQGKPDPEHLDLIGVPIKQKGPKA